MTEPKPVSSLLPTPRSLNDVSSLPIGVLEAEIAAWVRAGIPFEVLLPMRSLGSNAADASQVGDDWLDAWSFARWIWKTGADLTWSLDSSAHCESAAPFIRFAILLANIPELAHRLHSAASALCEDRSRSASPEALAFTQFRDVVRDSGAVRDEPFPDLRDRFATAFLVEIAEFAVETDDPELLEFWAGVYRFDDLAPRGATSLRA
ncbi:MAG: hypothetical protein ACOVT5_07625 [Armatimonadaceae bacterium]